MFSVCVVVHMYHKFGECGNYGHSGPINIHNIENICAIIFVEIYMWIVCVFLSSFITRDPQSLPIWTQNEDHPGMHANIHGFLWRNDFSVHRMVCRVCLLYFPLICRDQAQYMN